MKIGSYKISLPLYYILTATVIVGVIYFISNKSQIKEFAPSSKPQLINKNIWVMGDHVYFRYNCSYRDDYIEIPIDYASIHVYNENYFGDKNTIWNTNFTGCNPPTIVQLNPPVDIASFSVISNDTDLAKDKYGLIGIAFIRQKDAYGGEVRSSVRVSGLANNDFNYISNNIITSNNRAYFYDINNPSLSEIYQLSLDIKKIYKSDDLKGCLYFINLEKVFSFCRYSPIESERNRAIEVINADPLTFHKLGVGDYWADKDTVFFNKISLTDASTTDFVSLGEGYFASNKHIYFEYKKIADELYYQSFQVIIGQPTYDAGSCGSDRYWTDGNTVYYHGNSIGANPDNFVFSFFEGFQCIATGYAWDWKNFFYEGKRVPVTDPISFKVIKGKYARDAFHVFEQGVVMDGDPEQIEKDILDEKIPKVPDDTGHNP